MQFSSIAQENKGVWRNILRLPKAVKWAAFHLVITLTLLPFRSFCIMLMVKTTVVLQYIIPNLIINTFLLIMNISGKKKDCAHL